MVQGVLARGVAAALCVEGAFYCWGVKQRRALSVQLPRYDDPQFAPSGLPYVEPKRRRDVRRLMAAEFGVATEGAKATTPERGKRWVSGWFFDRPYSEIDREKVRKWVAWAWFNVKHVDEMSEAEAAEVEADIRAIEAATGEAFPPPSDAPSDAAPPPLPKSSSLFCMRPNVDKTSPFHGHKPIAIYFLTQFVIGYVKGRRVLSELGFERSTIKIDKTDIGTGRTASKFSYWHRPPPAGSDAAAAERAPIVLFHGIGMGWGFSYPKFVRDVVARADAAGGRPILAVELPHIALSVPSNYGPSPADAVSATETMIRRHSKSDRADFFGHSYGTVAVAHVLKQRPDLVRSAALTDPVCVGAYRATLCRTFLYEPDVGALKGGVKGVVGKIKGWLLHADPRLVGVLMRNFIWFENVLWLDEEVDAQAPQPRAGAPTDSASSEVALFIAENDRYIDGPIIYDDARTAVERRREQPQPARGRKLLATLWEDQDHGEWLGKAEQRKDVIDVLLRQEL